MSELPLSAWLILLLIVFLCHLATAKLIHLLPWSESAKNSRMPLFFGAAIAPFLLGFVTIFALKLFPEQSHSTHLTFIFFCLITCNVTAYLLHKSGKILYQRPSPIPHASFAIDEKISTILIAAFTALLLISALIFPLTQTDALEYAQMGKIIFDTTTLDSYPPHISSNHPSGFYLPVTHPPLYPALIYTSYIIQGFADIPIFMRLISPWCLIVATGLVFAAGCMINRRTGLFAAFLFISTPLLFMGAATSLLDSMTVLGFSLVFISIFCFSTSTIKLGLIQGSILGIALWTHSEGVLYPFLLIAGLLFYNGIGSFRKLTLQIASIILIATIVGIHPYLENYHNLGSFISDTPLVFSLENLAWDVFFLIGRGVDSLTSQIQYGLFKGWFALEAYGLTFWLITAGIFWLPKPPLKKLYQEFIGRIPNSKNILLSALMIIITYHAGVALAIILGINQIFRIERYMLILLPCISLIAAFVLSNCFEPRGQIKLRKIFATIVLLLISLQIAAFSLKQASMSSKPELQTLAFIKKNLPKNSLIFATQSADMYYANRSIIGNLDPQLENFYKAKTAEQGWMILKELGVTHIYVIANALPTFYNSKLQEIVANNNFTKMLYSAEGSQVYSLNPQKLNHKAKNIFDFSLNNIKWQRSNNLLIGGRKALTQIKLSSQEIKDKLYSETKIPISLSQRDVLTLLQTSPSIPVQSENEYQINFNLQGYGLLRFWLTQYNSHGKIIEKTFLLSELILSKKYSKKKAIYRFKTLPNAKHLKITIGHYGNSWLKITNPLLKEL